MDSLYNLSKQTTLTGVAILLMGLLTMTPEIYFSGIIVMIVSASLHISGLETIRRDLVLPANESSPQTEPHQFGAW